MGFLRGQCKVALVQLALKIALISHRSAPLCQKARLSIYGYGRLYSEQVQNSVFCDSLLLRLIGKIRRQKL